MTEQTRPNLAQIEARTNAATPGPWCTDSWEIYQGTEYEPGISMWIGETCRSGEMDDSRADAEFVAAARTDVPALLAEVRRLQAELAEYEVLSPQQCPKGVHADWLIDSEYGHACPWCQIDDLKAGLAAARTAAFTEAETGIATAIDWNRTEYPAVGGMITRRLGMRAAERVVRGLREEAEGGCPGFEGNPVAPDLCAGCHEPRDTHAARAAAGESGSTR